MRAVENPRRVPVQAHESRVGKPAVNQPLVRLLLPSCLLLAAIGYFPSSAAAQVNGPPVGRTVLSIRQQTGDAAEPMLSAAELANLVTQKTGEPYSADSIRESIERLYG